MSNFDGIKPDAFDTEPESIFEVLIWQVLLSRGIACGGQNAPRSFSKLSKN